MMGLVWIAFLLVTMMPPKVALQEDSPPLSLDQADDLSESKPKVSSVAVPVGRRFAHNVRRKALLAPNNHR